MYFYLERERWMMAVRLRCVYGGVSHGNKENVSASFRKLKGISSRRLFQHLIIMFVQPWQIAFIAKQSRTKEVKSNGKKRRKMSPHPTPNLFCASLC